DPTQGRGRRSGRFPQLRGCPQAPGGRKLREVRAFPTGSSTATGVYFGVVAPTGGRGSMFSTAATGSEHLCRSNVMSAAIQIAQMASPEPIPPSRRLSSAITAERDRLARELDRRRNRARALTRELTQEEDAISALTARIRLLDEVSGAGNQAEPSAPDLQSQPRVAAATRGVLRGARI